MTSRLRIDVGRQPADWTCREARAQFEKISQTISWAKAHGRPYRMADIVDTATLAIWEIQEAMMAKEYDPQRAEELIALAKTLGDVWAEMVGLPVLARSLEHQVALLQACWSIRLLQNMLDMWDAGQAGEEPKPKQGKVKNDSA